MSSTGEGENNPSQEHQSSKSAPIAPSKSSSLPAWRPPPPIDAGAQKGNEADEYRKLGRERPPILKDEDFAKALLAGAGSDEHDYIVNRAEPIAPKAEERSVVKMKRQLHTSSTSTSETEENSAKKQKRQEHHSALAVEVVSEHDDDHQELLSMEDMPTDKRNSESPTASPKQASAEDCEPSNEHETLSGNELSVRRPDAPAHASSDSDPPTSRKKGTAMDRGQATPAHSSSDSDPPTSRKKGTAIDRAQATPAHSASDTDPPTSRKKATLTDRRQATPAHSSPDTDPPTSRKKITPMTLKELILGSSSPETPLKVHWLQAQSDAPSNISEAALHERDSVDAAVGNRRDD